MKAYVFPGQGAQFVGMGKDLYDNNPLAKELFEKANEILGFRITDLMFAGTDEDLRQTKATQPAIFLHSVILAKTLGDQFKPDMVAGHSLGEFGRESGEGGGDQDQDHHRQQDLDQGETASVVVQLALRQVPVLREYRVGRPVARTTEIARQRLQDASGSAEVR